jgi:hypothetical protein
LFDNPIALEKNYRNLMITQVPSLEILDRSSKIKPVSLTLSNHSQSENFICFLKVISSEEKIKAQKCLNGDQEEAKTTAKNMKAKQISILKPVLMHSMEPTRQSKSNLSKKGSENSIDISSRTSLSDSSQLPIKSSEFRNSKTLNNPFQLSNDNGNNLRRSIKEFSYFDWPKVNIKKEENFSSLFFWSFLNSQFVKKK